MAPKDRAPLVDVMRKVAAHRRTDGQRLIEEGRFRGGMYLLGYAIECALKAYIGRQLGAETLSEADARYRERYGHALRLTSVRGHSLQWLLRAAEQLRLSVGANARVANARNLCLTWDHRWRYDPTPADQGEAHRFLEAVGVFHDWLIQRQ